MNVEFNVCFASIQKRATNTLEIILNILNKPKIEINKAWELNERHYGNLTGKNKDEIITKYGAKQVHIWRRSFDIRPPQIDKQHPYRDKINSNILSESSTPGCFAPNMQNPCISEQSKQPLNT